MSDETELDLRPYILELVRYWYLIILIPIIAAAGTYLYFKVQPPIYKATAMVVVTEAEFLVNLDSRIQTAAEGRPAYRVLPVFATSSELVLQVFDALDPRPENIDTAEKLQGLMTAESGDDIRFVFLTVTMQSPDDAAQIANVWADLFIQKAHSVYSDTGEDEVAFFEKQMTDNLVELEQAEQDVIDFQTRNNLSTLRNELSLNRDNHLTFMRQMNTIDSIIRDLVGLKKNISSRNANEPASFADQLSFFSLQTATYNAGDSLPVFFQLPETIVLTEQTVGDQLAAVDELVDYLQEKYLELNNLVEETSPIIITLQEQIKELETEQTHLDRTLDLKREIDSMLTRKLEEVNLASQSAPSAFRLAGKAIAPIKSAGPSKLTNTAIAGVFVGILTVGGILARYLWISTAPEDQTPASEPVKKSKIKRLFGGNGKDDKIVSQEKLPESTEE